MKVVLIRPPRPNMHYVSFGEQTFPIGMGFLIASLRENGHDVTFFDNYLEPNNPFNVDYLIEHKIDFVGMYICSITLPQAIRILEKVQILREQKRWSGKIMVGGPHPSIAPDSLPSFIDFVVRGEGEKAIVDIVEGKCSDRIIQYPRLKDLDDLPFPAYDVLLNMPYNTRFAMMDQYKMANMNTSRGCPYGCTFCSVDQFWGKQYTYFSAERVISDIERLMKEFNRDAIYFREDNFLVNKKRTLDICDLLNKKNIKIAWGCEARVDALQDEDFVKTISLSGCKHVFLGVESLTQRVLDLMNKKITIAQIERAVELCNKYDIIPFASFIIGLPGETEEEMLYTLSRAKEMFPERMYAINPFVGYPYSEMYYTAVKEDLVGFRDKNDFLYLKKHDELTSIAFNIKLPDYRLNPSSFVDRVDNLNNIDLSAILEDKKEGKTLEIRQKVQSGEKTEWTIGYSGLLDLSQQLSKGQKYDTILLNNMLHLVHQDDLNELFQLLSLSLNQNGKIHGITLDREEQELNNALMHHYFSEYLYNQSDLSIINNNIKMISIKFKNHSYLLFSVL